MKILNDRVKTKLHLDTDLGGDIDDLCALAMLLRRNDVEITAITTVAENEGKRAGYVRYVLALEGRSDIPVAAGVDGSLGCFREKPGLPPEEIYWLSPVPPLPGHIDDTFALIKNSIDQGAIIVGIGPYTNFYLFDQKYPGYLAKSTLYLMGGYVYPPRPGFPQWGNEMDYNVQVDIRSSRYMMEHFDATLVPLSVTVETALRRTCLPALRTSGALGELIARQAEAFADEWKNETRYGKTYDRLPDDLINFQHDPLACAIALGWNEGVEIADVPLILEEKEGRLVERVDGRGKPTKVVVKVDGQAFNQYWLRSILHPDGFA